MIFLDTNYFVRYITLPRNEDELQMSVIARDLLRRMRKGEVTLTSSEAIIAETIYVLSGAPYLASRYDIATNLLAILEQPSFFASQKPVWRWAFDIWLEHPGLSFVDGLGAAYSMHGKHMLATFDKRLSRHPGPDVYSPASN